MIYIVQFHSFFFYPDTIFQFLNDGTLLCIGIHYHSLFRPPVYHHVIHQWTITPSIIQRHILNICFSLKGICLNVKSIKSRSDAFPRNKKNLKSFLEEIAGTCIKIFLARWKKNTWAVREADASPHNGDSEGPPKGPHKGGGGLTHLCPPLRSTFAERKFSKGR